MKTQFPYPFDIVPTKPFNHATTHCTLAALQYVFPEAFELSNYPCESRLRGMSFFFFFSSSRDVLFPQRSMTFCWHTARFCRYMMCMQASRKQAISPTTISTPLWHRNFPQLSGNMHFFDIWSLHTRSCKSPNVLHTVSQAHVSCEYVVRDSIITTTTWERVGLRKRFTSLPVKASSYRKWDASTFCLEDSRARGVSGICRISSSLNA